VRKAAGIDVDEEGELAVSLDVVRG
jgi:hypothetical protein